VLEDRSGKVVGVEVKAAATLGSNDVRGLQALASAVGKNWVGGSRFIRVRRQSPFLPICTAFPSADSGRLDDRGRERRLLGPISSNLSQGNISRAE